MVFLVMRRVVLNVGVRNVLMTLVDGTSLSLIVKLTYSLFVFPFYVTNLNDNL